MLKKTLQITINIGKNKIRLNFCFIVHEYKLAASSGHHALCPVDRSGVRTQHLHSFLGRALPPLVVACMLKIVHVIIIIPLSTSMNPIIGFK